ncbi:hypothetical protein [Francisella frigiditurris]|uniref:Putative membrane protein n=1 Tax=Francisella frigiditurris TaxID=1542390 RepID=A0A1J0KTG5_9GAMM|nr:hypothetical protein [Francisella frigiditurris]APC96942.1 putative membrane protein [Francisella frigiditurris]
MKYIKNKFFIIGLVIVLAVSIGVFYESFYHQVWSEHIYGVSDVPLHVNFIIKSEKVGAFPLYSIWFYLVYIISFMSNSYKILAYTSIVLLSVFVIFKYLITYIIISDGSNKKWLVATVSTLMIFAMPIISFFNSPRRYTHIYLGNISPNIWHNSTLIFAMPFYIMLFSYSINKILSFRNKDIIIIATLFMVATLCKPNFILAFAPVFFIVSFWYILFNERKTINICKVSTIGICICAILLIQFISTFMHNEIFPKVSTGIAPLKVWSLYSPHILLSCLLSFTFPVSVTLLYMTKVIYEKEILLSWLTVFIATMMFAVFIQYPDWQSANFVWGAIAANYILFVYCVKFLINQKIDYKSIVCYMIFIMHFISGFIFFKNYSLTF